MPDGLAASLRIPTHGILLLLRGGIRRKTHAGEKVQAGSVAEGRPDGAEHGRFVGNLFDARFAQRQDHVGEGGPDIHGDTAQQSGEQNAFGHCESP
jgi:hypothetical protein